MIISKVVCAVVRAKYFVKKFVNSKARLTFNFRVNVAPIQTFPLIVFVQFKTLVSNCFVDLQEDAISASEIKSSPSKLDKQQNYVATL